MITAQNVVRHELIGLKVKVVQADGRCACGTVADETKNMVYVMSGSEIVRFPKDKIVLDITIPSGDVVRVNGKLLMGRPEERVRKKLPGKWKMQD